MRISLRTLGLCKQAYYAWRKCPHSRRERENEKLLPLIRQIHENDPAFGYRFITDELKAMGLAVNEKRVLRLCNINKIYSVIHKKGKRYSKVSLPAHDDLVRRDFSASDVNQLWLTDITEHNTLEGKLYLCAIKDVYSNRIVGYSIGSRAVADLVVEALDKAMLNRGYPKGVVIHSDRGGQFRSHIIRSRLKQYEAKGSMGRAGTCADNAAMESFYSLVQKNVLDRRKTWQTRQELRIEMTRWINSTYNSIRRQRGRKKLSPIDYEKKYAKLS